jgi:predicted ATP-dependent endonuclease of OLD family
VEDSGEFDLERQTCLVGKNEAGKTAILSALAALNPHPSTPCDYDLERDYPRRHLADYEERHPDEDAEIIKTDWAISQQAKEDLVSEFGEDFLTSDTVTISAHYNEKAKRWILPGKEATAIENILKGYRLSASEFSQLKGIKTSKELLNRTQELSPSNEKMKSIYGYMNGLENKSILSRVRAILESHLPQFMYFSHYDRMVGTLRVDTFEKRKRGEAAPAITQNEQVFVDFLHNAGTSLEEIRSATTYESLQTKCEAASNKITDQLLEYWEQNPDLAVVFQFSKGQPDDPPPFNEGLVARARVQNTLHKVTVPFSERSAGFIWFFSFLVKFSQIKKTQKNVILLLDEPGLTLHGKAQGDLLRFFKEQLLPEHQLMFTTHSPFMVPADDLPSVRLVEDKVHIDRRNRRSPEGTKVRADVLGTERDTLFPLQGALGYELSQTLFVGKHTLLVEGPSDLLYLQALSTEAERRGFTYLDQRWTICPAGGIDKIQPFISLFYGSDLNIAVVTDYATGDKKKIERFRNNKILSDERLLNMASVLEKEEADTEDILERGFYLEIVARSVGLTAFEDLLQGKEVSDFDEFSRNVSVAEALCRTLGADFPEYDHYLPALYLFRNQQLLQEDTDRMREIVRKSSVLFQKLNSLLE